MSDSMSDETRENLQYRLILLGQRLLELEQRIAEDDDDSRRSLHEAIGQLNAIAGLLGMDEHRVTTYELVEDESDDDGTT
jgi:hypothetical protein